MPLINMNTANIYKDIVDRLNPCLHCGKKITEKELYHQDYIGDSYIGDEYELNCTCGISVTFTDKENLIDIWNRNNEI